jgi:hypothetical protein
MLPKAQRACIMQPRSAERQRVLSWEPRTTLDPRRIMNLNEVPSHERPCGHASPPDGTALRSGNGMGAVWHAKPKGASLRLGTLGLHDGTALRFNAESDEWPACSRKGRYASIPGCMAEPLRGSMADGRKNLHGGTAWRSNRRSACINLIAAFLTFLDLLDR